MRARKKIARPGGYGQKQIVIDQVLSEIQKAQQNAQNRITDPDFPELESVLLTLQTAVTIGVGGKIKFLIFSFGMSWEKEQSQELVLTLTPPRPGGPKMRSLADELADAIVDAAEGVKKAKTGEPPLLLDRLNASIAFVVTEQVSGGASFEIKLVTLELSGNLKKKALHKIELRFKKKTS